MSCTPKQDRGFSVEFSDGSALGGADITFYDSSTCVLFLEKDLDITYAMGDPPDVVFTEFSVLVNEEIIYEGIIYPDMLWAAPSPEPFYISSFSYPVLEGSILRFMHLGFFTETDDVRNDVRIINSLKKSNLLNSGLSCTIDSIWLSPTYDSVVHCTVTIVNNDPVSYYIPDPEKMGNGHFNYYTGGIVLKHIESDMYYHPEYPNSTVEWNHLEMGDLTLLDGRSCIKFTVASSYYTEIPEGEYDCVYYYGTLRHIYSFNLELKQPDGRIWIGECHSGGEFLLSTDQQ